MSTPNNQPSEGIRLDVINVDEALKLNEQYLASIKKYSSTFTFDETAFHVRYYDQIKHILKQYDIIQKNIMENNKAMEQQRLQQQQQQGQNPPPHLPTSYSSSGVN